MTILLLKLQSNKQQERTTGNGLKKKEEIII
jgi:hypothetical protein